MEKIILDGKTLSIDDIYKISIAKPNTLTLGIHEDSKRKMDESHAYIKTIVERGNPVYSINTGFGALSNKRIPDDQLVDLQYNLIRSHFFSDPSHTVCD